MPLEHALQLLVATLGAVVAEQLTGEIRDDLADEPAIRLAQLAVRPVEQEHHLSHELVVPALPGLRRRNRAVDLGAGVLAPGAEAQVQPVDLLEQLAEALLELALGLRAHPGNGEPPLSPRSPASARPAAAVTSKGNARWPCFALLLGMGDAGARFRAGFFGLPPRSRFSELGVVRVRGIVDDAPPHRVVPEQRGPVSRVLGERLLEHLRSTGESSLCGLNGSSSSCGSPRAGSKQ